MIALSFLFHLPVPFLSSSSWLIINQYLTRLFPSAKLFSACLAFRQYMNSPTSSHLKSPGTDYRLISLKKFITVDEVCVLGGGEVILQEHLIFQATLNFAFFLK